MKKFLLAVTVILIGLLGYAAFQPKEMHISRELLIKATAEIIFPHINNSKLANEWMPWTDSDPQVKMQYSGAEEGVGSTSSWQSEGDMGTGQAIVIESTQNELVKTQLTYTKPMNMSQLAEITLTPQEAGTLVRWSVKGENSFVVRLLCIFFNMDKKVGGEFEKGLKKLQAKVE